MENKHDAEIKKLLSEIRSLESDIERKQRFGNDYAQLIDTINRKTKLIEILMTKEA